VDDREVVKLFIALGLLLFLVTSMLFALGASKGAVTESQKPRKKKRATKASLKSLLSEINDPSSAEEASQLLDIYYYDKAMHKEASRVYLKIFDELCNEYSKEINICKKNIATKPARRREESKALKWYERELEKIMQDHSTLIRRFVKYTTAKSKEAEFFFMPTELWEMDLPKEVPDSILKS